jgi:hypothetical protein
MPPIGPLEKHAARTLVPPDREYKCKRHLDDKFRLDNGEEPSYQITMHGYAGNAEMDGVQQSTSENALREDVRNHGVKHFGNRWQISRWERESVP